MWLQVSTKGEYGVRIMVDLARHYGEQPRSLSDIAQTELLPLAYLGFALYTLGIATRWAAQGYWPVTTAFEAPLAFSFVIAATYLVAGRVTLVLELKSATGKVLKRQLREPFWQNHTRRV